MPDPREAVYDVLLAKKRRAEEAQRQQEQRNEFYRTKAEAWAQYEEENARANAATKSPRGNRGSNPRLVVIDELSDFQETRASET